MNSAQRCPPPSYPQAPVILTFPRFLSQCSAWDIPSWICFKMLMGGWQIIEERHDKMLLALYAGWWELECLSYYSFFTFSNCHYEDLKHFPWKYSHLKKTGKNKNSKKIYLKKKKSTYIPFFGIHLLTLVTTPSPFLFSLPLSLSLPSPHSNLDVVSIFISIFLFSEPFKSKLYIS